MLQYIRRHGSSDTHAEMEFLLTKKGGRALIFEGHKYVVNRRGRDGRIFGGVGEAEPAGEQLQHWRMTSFHRGMSTTIHQMRRSKRQQRL